MKAKWICSVVKLGSALLLTAGSGWWYRLYVLGHSQAEADDSVLFAGVEVVTVYGRIENSSHTHIYTHTHAHAHTHRPCAIRLL